MAFVSKYVGIACLTYFLYGLISQFNEGVFLPPLPLHPFLLLLFVILGTIHLIKAGFLLSELLMVLVIALMAIQQHSFLETFTSQTWMYAHESRFSEVVTVVAFILLFVHAIATCIPLLHRLRLIWFVMSGIVVLFLYAMIFDAKMTLLVPLLIWSLFVFVLRRDQQFTVQRQLRFAPLLYGTTALQCIDEFTLFLFS